MITELLLEVKPPKVPLKKLIEKGYIKENQELYDKDGNEKVWKRASPIMATPRFFLFWIHRPNNNGTPAKNRTFDAGLT